ncbi:hypothetical protein [Actinomadura sp. SCN-SB]|uniref:hypothetical protein n=1 Tax=Actinomadura sp. SCN-SB TaxID=3373092 RepID=UPI003753C3EE
MSDTTPTTAPASSTSPHAHQSAEGTAPPPKGKLRDFAEIMQQQFKTALRGHALGALLLPLLLLLVGAGLGTLIRALTAPTVGTVVTTVAAAALEAMIVVATVIAYRRGPDPSIDWATAAPYQQRLTEGLPDQVRHLLAGAQARVQRQRPVALDVYLFSPRISDEHARICTLDTGYGCPCWGGRINACVVPARLHPVLVVGDRLLAQPEALAFVLAHEVHHARRPWFGLRLVLGGPVLLGWLPLALAVPGRHLLVIAPAVWAATMLLRWIDELAADVAAARTTPPGTARTWWELYRESRPRPRRRARQFLFQVLAPAHPPVTLRAALTTQIQQAGPA